MPLSPFNGTLGKQRAAHLLRRVTFGGSKQQIDQFANMTAPEAISDLFNLELPEPPLPLDLTTGTEWITLGPIEDLNSGEQELRSYFKRWYIGQMLASDIEPNLQLRYSTREKITLFLHTHFTTMEEKVGESRALFFQNQLFRLFAFDKDDRTVDIVDDQSGDITNEVAPTNFKELVKKVCVDNAMLIFLDGDQNVNGSPNENYAREMFELYTIGRGLEARVNNMPPSGPGDYFTFTEQDVQAAARVLTGFKFDENYNNIDLYTGLPIGITNINQHTVDSDEKEFSAYFNSQIIEPDPLLLNGGLTTPESMTDEVSKMVDMIFDQEETARHICRKLYRFYVYYEISEAIDDTIIAEMANTFIANDYKIQPVLENLFTSEHFYEAVAGFEDDKFGGIIKSPLDLVLGITTLFEFQLPNYQTELNAFYDETGKILEAISVQGMDFYQPFEVAGYSAYHQFPIYNRNWISTNYLTQRYNYIRELFSENPQLPYNFVNANFGGNATDAKQLIIELAQYIFPFSNNLGYEIDGGDLTKERMRYFLQAFLQFTDYNETEMVNMILVEWEALYSNPANYLESGEFLRRLFNAMMQSPEYQLF